MDYQQKCVEIIRNASSNGKPIKCRDIATALSSDEPYVRRLVAQARSGGTPIVATRYGYRYSENTEDIRQTILSLRNRISTQERATAGLERHLLAER